MTKTAVLWHVDLIALVSAFLAIKPLKPIFIYFNLVGIPPGRKQHVGHIPLVGGLTVYVGVLWCVALPVIDTLVVIIKRLKAGCLPFHPDRNHFHHMLQDMGLGPREILLAMVMMALALVVLGGVVQLLWPSASFGLFCVVTIGYLYWAKRRGWGVETKASFGIDLKASNEVI